VALRTWFFFVPKYPRLALRIFFLRFRDATLFFARGMTCSFFVFPAVAATRY
jgi:hypothetical protein